MSPDQPVSFTNVTTSQGDDPHAYGVGIELYEQRSGRRWTFGASALNRLSPSSVAQECWGLRSSMERHRCVSACGIIYFRLLFMVSKDSAWRGESIRNAGHLKL